MGLGGSGGLVLAAVGDSMKFKRTTEMSAIISASESGSEVSSSSATLYRRIIVACLECPMGRRLRWVTDGIRTHNVSYVRHFKCLAFRQFRHNSVGLPHQKLLRVESNQNKFLQRMGSTIPPRSSEKIIVAVWADLRCLLSCLLLQNRLDRA